MVKRVPKNVRVPVLQFCWRMQRPLAEIIKWYKAEDGEFVCYLQTPSDQPDFGIILRGKDDITILDVKQVRTLFKREHHFDAEAS